ncbi:hypothetical protein [Terriglobus sp. TAA 43]|uniref:hypothetical protein n=1 Tax=Terriglobus sp. TAA 43 TaxID=278961 RepID=UPI000645E6DA|nr:hypothetical protein [Terriglobus sp. TAA 43]
MANIKEIEEVIMVIGSKGSDGGYSVLTPHGLLHVPGNNPLIREAYAALVKANLKVQEIAQKQHAG